MLAGTLQTENPVLVMSSVLPAAPAVPPPLAQPAVLREGGLEWAGGCSGVTPFVGGDLLSCSLCPCPGQPSLCGFCCSPSLDAFRLSSLLGVDAGDSGTQPGEGALPGKGSQNSPQPPWEEMSCSPRVPSCPQQALPWLGWNPAPLQHQASVLAPRFNTLLENERLEHVPEDKEIYCCPGPAAKQNSNNPNAGRTINPCWQSHC